MHRLRLPIAMFTFGVTIALGCDAMSRPQDASTQQEGLEILARGPVHEAFAQPSDTQPQPGSVAKKPPPEPIEEVAPDQKPDGENVQWIPGYWAWEDDDNDYLWVSGCWRDAPPGRRWLPGNWQETDKGWLWVTGFWAPLDIQEVLYVPPPPPTLEKGPSTPAPNASSIYAPGIWVYRENRFFWRPGHWIVHQPEWVWIPAYYVWTPSGCVLVDDYWDYPIDECGLLFAPVHFDLGTWRKLQRPFRPQYVVHADFLLTSLFVSPHRRHYYFGDYFEDRYAKRGFVAWIDYHPSPGALDPFFSYYLRLHGSDPNWETSVRALDRARRSGEVPRPPHNLKQQAQIVGKITGDKTANSTVQNNVNLTHIENVRALVVLKEIDNAKITRLGSLSQDKKDKGPPTTVKLKSVSKDDQAREIRTAAQFGAAAKQRQEHETNMFIKGGNPIKATDKSHALQPTPPKTDSKVTATTTKKSPAALALPKIEERPLPKYDPPPPPVPPKKDAQDKKDKKDKNDKNDKKG